MSQTVEGIFVESGVSIFDGSPFVTLRWGSQSGQLTPLEAEQHGLGVIGAAIAARIDSAVVAELTEQVGVSQEVAAAFLLGLRRRVAAME